MYVITHLFKSIECATPESKPKGKLWTLRVMMHWRGFSLNEKCAILMSDADNGGGGGLCMCWGEVYMGNLLPASNFILSLKLKDTFFL